MAGGRAAGVLALARVRGGARTGCSVVAVERGDEVLVDLGADFRFQEGDAVYVCGPGEKASRFEEALRS